MTDSNSTTKKQPKKYDNIVPIKGAKGTTYKVVIRKKGYATITKSFKTLKEAKDWRDDIKGSTDQLNRLGGRGARKTLGEVIDAYGNGYQGNDKSVPQKLSYWKERLGDWRIADVTSFVVAEELDRLLNESAKQPLRGKKAGETARQRSQATVNRYHSTLSNVFKLAKKKGFIKENPTRGIERGGETSRFGRALSDDEREALLKACEASEWDRLYLLVSMALTTGARVGELFSLTWGDIDLKKGLAKLTETKNKSPRWLPLVPAVLDQLNALPTQIDKRVYVFPSEKDPHKSYYNGFRKHWDKALADAEIENFRFHDLRHSAASYLTEAGVPLVTVAEILGHRTLQMVQRYSHVHTEQKAKVVTETFKDLLG